MISAKIQGDPVYFRWVDWNNISADLPLAAVVAEDQRFTSHWGFDLVEIQDAVWTALRGGRLRGASTITQQVAKNLFLWSGRSFVRKTLEAYFTILLEIFWSKRRILEVYINVAQFGQGVYGASVASDVFFNTKPQSLTRVQASLLVAALPSPRRFIVNRPSGTLLQRAKSIRQQMRALGGLNYLSKL